MDKKSSAVIIMDMMNLIYKNNLTTVSGGNLSVLEQNGDIWISPSGVDKGALQENDMVCLKPDGERIGRNPASIELPFHQQIYQASPETKAIIHVHAPNLIAASIIRQVPKLEVLPHCAEVIGNVGIAPYDVPGGAALGKKIADVFAQGNDCVILENHGIVIGAETMRRAYERLEAINLMFEIQASGGALGRAKAPSCPRTELWKNFTLRSTARARTNVDLAKKLHPYTQRIWEKGFSLSNPEMFCISARTEGGMLVNPCDLPLYELTEASYQTVTAQTAQNYHQKAHLQVYNDHPDINFIVTTLAPNILCFAVTGTPFQTEIIPESYVVLQRVKQLSYADYGDTLKISGSLAPSTNALVFDNGCALCCGPTPLKMYDRIEVLEYSAKAVLDAKKVGDIVYIEGDAIKDIISAFGLPE